MEKRKKVLIVLIDLFLVNISYLITGDIIYYYDMSNIYNRELFFISMIYLVSFLAHKVYKTLWDLNANDELLVGGSSIIMAGIVSTIYTTNFGKYMPLNINLLAMVLVMAFTLGYRTIYRAYRRYSKTVKIRNSKEELKRVMVIGAGAAGQIIINEMMTSNELKYNPILLIDDDKNKRDQKIYGIKVEGTRNDIQFLVKKYDINEIIIAIPTIDNKNKAQIINICKRTNCKVKIIPGIYEILSGKAKVTKIKDVDLEDLLGRDPVKLNEEGINDYIEDKIVLVTGGGGSIGSELCRQIVKFNPKLLVVFDIYENNAYDIQNELISKNTNSKVKVLIGSVRDKNRLQEIFDEYNIDVVFHAAAHKHVPLMEDSPKEAIKNNIFGTLNLANLSDKYGIEKFVLISTDKAVNPTNIMGATKRVCEMIVQGINKVSNTEYVAVRFGNVLGSNGSVIPLFKKQIKAGGPVTVTDKRITRYFMLIQEAAQLVLEAGAYAKEGEIFILDMGKPVKIYNLANDLIKLSGLEPNKDIKVKVTGLRPGEKLYEELLMNEEGLKATKNKKIFIGRPTFESIDVLEKKLKEMKTVLDFSDELEVIDKLREIVPTYREAKEVNEVAIGEA